MPLFDMILSEAGVIRYELELPRAQLELTSRLTTATLLKPAHPGGSKKKSRRKKKQEVLVGNRQAELQLVGMKGRSTVRSGGCKGAAAIKTKITKQKIEKINAAKMCPDCLILLCCVCCIEKAEERISKMYIWLN